MDAREEGIPGRSWLGAPLDLRIVVPTWQERSTWAQITPPRPRNTRNSCIQQFDAVEFVAFQHVQTGAASGRDVAHLIS